MFTKQQLLDHISQLGIAPNDTLLIHSSMKSIGAVEGGADTVLDAFSEYMQDGLLILPTHTWKQMSAEYNVFDVENEPSCVGILTELFRKRSGVVRSWHPTHSVAALGADAADYIAGEEQWDTPCSQLGCYGKLYDRQAKILFIGIGFERNTTIHGVEEWNDIDNRLGPHVSFQVRTPGGTLLERPMRRHVSPVPHISERYVKLEEPCIKHGIATVGQLGDARTILADVVPMTELTSAFLQREPELFLNYLPIPKDWY